MLPQIEKAFVRAFVMPNRRERVLFMLNHPKKREQIVRWSYEEHIYEPSAIHLLKGIADPVRDITAELKRRGAAKEIYYFHPDPVQSGMMPLQQAIERLYDSQETLVFDPTVPLAFTPGSGYEKVLLCHA